jgi:polyphosphate kinase 2
MGKKKDAKKAAKKLMAAGVNAGTASDNGASEGIVSDGASNGTAAGTADRSKEPMSRKDFEKALEPLQVELVHLQDWVVRTGAKICVVFEGRDTAGKGGVIKRLTERVSPRVFRVVALPAPTEREKSQMYIQRYIPYLPAAGEVVVFDRSWYNRAGVERVMGFTSQEQVERFLRVLPAVERAIIDSGIILIKYWLDVGADEQTKRLKERITDGRKTWKLSPMDLKSYMHWDDYTRARDDMFAATDTDDTPWSVVDANDQKRARLNCIAHFLSQIPYDVLPSEKIELPDRHVSKHDGESKHPFRYVPEKY